MKLKIFPVGPLGTNCYFIIDENTKTAAVVDPGYDAAYIHGKLSRLGVTCKMILLTHGHADHTGALGELRRRAGAPVYIHAGDVNMLSDPALSGLYPRGRRKHAFRPCAVAGKVYRHGGRAT